MENEYQRPIDEIFEHIDTTPLGSASLAQVHRADARNRRGRGREGAAAGRARNNGAGRLDHALARQGRHENHAQLAGGRLPRRGGGAVGDLRQGDELPQRVLSDPLLVV